MAPTCHPLSAEYKLVIAPGILTGTGAPCSGRLSAGAKSPLTGTIKESNSGGMGAIALATAGVKAIVLEGKPADQVGQLTKERVRVEVVKQAAIVRPFIQMEADRWVPGTGMGADVWEHNIANVLKFVDEREEVVVHHLDELRYQTFTECK